MGKRYQGINEYIGLNGCYRIYYDDPEFEADPIIEIFLKSVLIYEDDKETEELVKKPFYDRSSPDISIGIFHEESLLELSVFCIPHP